MQFANEAGLIAVINNSLIIIYLLRPRVKKIKDPFGHVPFLISKRKRRLNIFRSF